MVIMDRDYSLMTGDTDLIEFFFSVVKENVLVCVYLVYVFLCRIGLVVGRLMNVKKYLFGISNIICCSCGFISVSAHRSCSP